MSEGTGPGLTRAQTGGVRPGSVVCLPVRTLRPGHGSRRPTAAALQFPGARRGGPQAPLQGWGGVSWSSQACSSSPSGRSVQWASGMGCSSDPVILWGPESLLRALLFGSWGAFPTRTEPQPDSGFLQVEAAPAPPRISVSSFSPVGRATFFRTRVLSFLNLGRQGHCEKKTSHSLKF